MLSGREMERAALAALLEDARGSRGGALVVRGEPGVGKSALLADLAGRAEGMQVLRTSGIESESPLPFAALQRLLRPALRLASRLPAPQARALRAVFGEEEGGGDRFLVFLAALSLLAEAAEESPVLAVVDDAHWLDDASAAALLFVARRIDVERIALVFAARSNDVRRFDSGDVPSITLEGISREAAAELLAVRAGGPVPAGVRDRLIHDTAGNPLALVELAAVLTPRQLCGQEPMPAQLPLTEGVERAFLDRYHRMPASTRSLMLVAAADDSGRVQTVTAAAKDLGVSDDAMDVAERSGLLHVVGNSIELRHPLVRTAVYGAATSHERRRAHRALADALVGDEEADRRAWHLAAAVDGPDEAVVTALDAAAERARARGGLEAAASAWQRAAELTGPGEARAQRLYAAARSAWLAAQPGRARALAEAALSSAAAAGLRADIARLQARIEWNTGSVHVGYEMIVRAAREAAAGDEPVRAREMAMFAAALVSFGAQSATSVDLLALVPPPAPDDPPRVRAFHGLLAGVDHVRRGEWEDAARIFRDTFAITGSLEEEDQDLLANLGIAALHLGDDERSLEYHNLLLSRARATGAVIMILYALTRRGFSDLATGRWTALRAGLSESLPLAHGSGQPGLAALPLSQLALLAALRGDESFEERAAEAERVAASHPIGVVEHLLGDFLRWARGMRAIGQPLAAFHHLEQIGDGPLRRMAAIDRIEAAIRADQLEVARAWTDEVRTFAEATGAPWAAAAVEHGLALLARDPVDAERHFEQALAHHARSLRRPDRARTELAYGEFLRRTRRRVDARAHLRAALGVFEDVGAGPLAERAMQELRASGETARRRDPSTVTNLTAQELQVASLVGEGLSNREVAAQLYLSPRTIDFHLRNVFAKLGVSSRGELARMSFE